MKDADIKRNASGYYDPTAYEAIKSIMKGENKMNKGEIWEAKQSNGTFKNVIVIADHGKFCTVLNLCENYNPEQIEVVCQGIMYTDPRKLQYTFNDMFTNFIRTMKDEEFDYIMEKIADGLGLDKPQPTETVEEKSKEAFIPCPEPTIDLFDIEAIKDAERAKAERDVYKGLYEKLLADVMQPKKGNNNG